jgi:heme ABC exporter ATP-binding subunit CcmA
MPLVSLNQVTKLFGRFAALRQISADFEPGRIYAILGENGAGKSTLLRVIAGLAQPTSGILKIHGITYKDDRARLHRLIGYMAHASMLYDELTAMENLQYFGALCGASDKQHCADLLAQVGIDANLQRRICDFSQGMKQRVSLARAMLQGPELLLLDEPFSNLDVPGAHEIIRSLVSLRDAGKTIFIVTHQLAYVDAIADDFLTLSHGEVVARTPKLLGVVREVAR